MHRWRVCGGAENRFAVIVAVDRIGCSLRVACNAVRIISPREFGR